MRDAALVLVLLSGLFHAVWNVLAKKSVDKYAFLWLAQLVGIAVFFIPALHEALTMRWTIESVLLLAGSALLHGLYTLLLARLYTIGDLSFVYPLIRGIGPLLVPLFGIVVLRERLSGYGWLGVAMIAAGIWSLGDWRSIRRAGQGGGQAKVMRLGVAVGVVISGYILFDKMALTTVPVISLNWWGTVGNLAALSGLALREGAARLEWRLNRWTVLIAGVIATGGYQLYLAAMPYQPIAVITPLREIGTVFGALLGALWLHERQGRRRIASAAAITAGVILLGALR